MNTFKSPYFSFCIICCSFEMSNHLLTQGLAPGVIFGYNREHFGGVFCDRNFTRVIKGYGGDIILS